MGIVPRIMVLRRTLTDKLLRGVEQVLPAGALEQKLALGRPLRVKAGFDPTASDLHLGHTVIMHKLRQFQDAGHEVIFLIGDFTARIGDPSGRTVTRPQLEEADIADNAETYQRQAFHILDRERTRVEFNSSWLGQMSAADLIRLASHQTVARMLERDDFDRRYRSGQAIAVHEFLYPLAQAYDSVHLRADIELGGTDQTFNLLMGRQLQQDYGQPGQLVMTLPILEGYTQGAEKMSKSLDNHIGITEAPEQQYGKLMRIDDDKMWRYFNLLSLRPDAEMEALRKTVSEGGNPRDAKMALARELVGRFYGTQVAEQAQADFVQRFRERELPEDIPHQSLQIDPAGLSLVNILKMAELVSSTSEGHRMVRQGAVRVDGEKIVSGNPTFSPGVTHVFQVGKRRVAQIELRSDAG